MKKRIVGVMGGGKGSEEDMQNAYELGKLIAEKGWVLLNGGRSAGIMESSAKGAKEAGGLTVGILPGKDGAGASEYIDIQIITGAGDARNYYNVLSSDVVIACKGGAGTLSEIALALKRKKNVILLNFDVGEVFSGYRNAGLLHAAESPEDAVNKAEQFIGEQPGHR
ncbi:MAG: TIGR00725 family protein [Desulfatiglans sp.]|jgi:uncharacterized protein (TIGR00725 family)|nr:TIGR00725 family protein [Desulfatiglans sp.]